jgi:hypothetical protein
MAEKRVVDGDFRKKFSSFRKNGGGAGETRRLGRWIIRIEKNNVRWAAKKSPG